MERARTTGLQADHFGGSIAAFNHHYLPRMHRLGSVASVIPGIQLIIGEMPTGSHCGEVVDACNDCRRYWRKFRAE